MNITEKRINEFINDVKSMFGPELIVGYEFCDEMEIYNIWHNEMELDLDDDSLAIVDRLINKHFDGFYDFCFAYDFDKSSQLKESFDDKSVMSFINTKTNWLEMHEFMNYNSEIGELAA